MELELDGLVIQIGVSLVFTIGVLVALFFLRQTVRRFERKHGMHRHRGVFVQRVGKILLGLVLFVGLFGIWGLSLENFWVLLSSVLGLVAIGFFAVWSILSNIIAGVFLYFVNPFRIGDWVLLQPDEIEGEVLDITLMFTRLKDLDKNRIEVPNNLFFQRYLVVKAEVPLPKDKKPSSVIGYED